MRVLITGATGFIGRALVPRLQRDGHSVVVWARSDTRALALLGADIDVVSIAAGHDALVTALSRCEAVVNLAGEPLLGGRWTAARRAELRASRIETTEQLVSAMEAASPRPRVLVSGSAVGYYGDRGDESLNETSSHRDDFLSQLCQDWERAALRASACGVRVVLRAHRRRAWPPVGACYRADAASPFMLGAGGPIGSGGSIFPWIHLYRKLRDADRDGCQRRTVRRPGQRRRARAGDEPHVRAGTSAPLFCIARWGVPANSRRWRCVRSSARPRSCFWRASASNRRWRNASASHGRLPRSTPHCATSSWVRRWTSRR